jgi:quinol monooxygenase YgiN
MIKVIIERRVSNRKAALKQIIKMRRIAYPYGYLSGETMFDNNDPTLIVTASNWRNMEGWKEWEISNARDSLQRNIEPFLIAKPEIRTLTIMELRSDAKPI